ncbi:lysine-2,3-aminomutase-like protein [Lentisphaera profundi]|uniref:Lysine-2,3-aminomutase-like protein n=1 Tax=Lentisphaera profundi TaxID=1658616 RepID=A0ABY7VZE1_9BACT|nr:lysine-2,3-aminomutase-like protein [Lentisphaera profundi]WDE98232.1 lysine-2,3-aminomutase-like protein [Lentisphaera profundi]
MTYLRTSSDLLKHKLIAEDKIEAIEKVAEQFQVSLSPEVIKAFEHEEVRQQYLPSENELKILPEELRDPIGDQTFTPVKGITHRYPDRVLLKPLHTCSVYCRFCFRREKVGQADEILRQGELKKALNYIKDHKEIWEVILTGGDPLSLSAKKLSAILDELEAIEHVKIIRIHTRIPLVAPEKVTDELLEVLDREKATYLILHCNSHKELSDDVKKAIKRLSKSGLPLLSQSVLLKNINDSTEKLEKLFRSLLEIRVKPYYLHHPDLAQGTSHFRVSLENGRQITADLRKTLSGLAQPLYVLDVPGGLGKVPAGKEFIQESGKEAWKIQTIHDTFVDYQDYL